MASPYDASKHAVVALTEGLYNAVQSAEMPIGVSCLCPGWVRTAIMDSTRNWPAEFGEPPADDAAQEVVAAHVRRAIDEGTTPAAVTDLVVDAIRSDRYWIFPDTDLLDVAIERFHTIGEAINPSPPEDLPGLPPRSQMMAEVTAAMAASLDDS